MKTTNLMRGVALWLGLLAFGSTRANATVLAYEGFDYPSGQTLISQSATGSGFAGNWREFIAGNDAPVVAGSLAYADLFGNSVGVSGNRAQTLGGTTGRDMDISPTGNFGISGYLDSNNNIGADGKTLYASLLFQYVTIDGQYSSCLTISRDGDPDANQILRFETSQQNNLQLNAIGVGGSAFTPSAPVDTSPHFIVFKLQFNAGDDTVSAYLDPTNLQSESSAAVASLIAPNLSFDRISFADFQGANSQYVDEFRFGDSWTSVTTVPEPSTASIVLIVLAGTLACRACRRRH